MIYYVKEEAVFVKYGDEAAKLYYADEEKKKQEKAKRQEEEEKEFFRENIRSDKTYNILINELNKNINDEEIKIKIKTMIKYLYYNKIIVFGAGLFGLS